MKYLVRFNTTISLGVTLEAEDEEQAADWGWTIAEEYLGTIYGNGRGVTADATLDGIGASEVETVSE